MKQKSLLIIAAMSLSLAACENLPGTNEQQGAVIGAGAGGVAGHAITGGSAVGTIGGAAAGAAVGHEVGERQRRR